MRLLLDEHYSLEIAKRLRARGYDVVSVTERPDLRSRNDWDILEMAAAEQRALLTENVADFIPLAHRAARERVTHYGLVFTSPRSMPRSPRTIGLYVRALAALLDANPQEGAVADRIQWLAPARARS